MNSAQLLESLIELRHQLANNSEISAKTRSELDALDKQIDEMITSNQLNFEQTLTDQILALEVEFSTEHPILEKIMRDMIEKLSMMGI